MLVEMVPFLLDLLIGIQSLNHFLLCFQHPALTRHQTICKFQHPCRHFRSTSQSCHPATQHETPEIISTAAATKPSLVHVPLPRALILVTRSYAKHGGAARTPQIFEAYKNLFIDRNSCGTEQGALKKSVPENSRIFLSLLP